MLIGEAIQIRQNHNKQKKVISLIVQFQFEIQWKFTFQFSFILGQWQAIVSTQANWTDEKLWGHMHIHLIVKPNE